MSIRACIPGMVGRGEITPEKGEEMRQLFDELEPQFRRQFGDQAAEAMASDATLRELEARLQRRKMLEAGTLRTRARMITDMSSYGDGREPGKPFDRKAALALFAPGDRRAGYRNVEGLRRAIMARSHAMMDGILAKFHAGIVRVVAHKALLEDVVREAFGEGTGNAAARELAQAWHGTAEMLRMRFNAAGGAIGKLDGWGMPQAHDTRAARKAGFEAWRDFIAPLLDRDKMVDSRTGLPFSDQAMELALRDVFETIRTDGWNKRSEGSAGKGALASQRSDARFLMFRNADAWMTYQERFGVGSAFDAMMGHVAGMSRDIALMEVLGPNPGGSLKWLKDTLTKAAELDTSPDSKAIDVAHSAAQQVQRYYDEITGTLGRPENRTIALAFSTVRSLQTAAKLGGAVLSAIPTDPAFGLVTRKFNGLPAAKMLWDYAKLFRPGAVEDQRLAVRLTGIAEEWAKRTGGQQRVLGEELTNDVARRLAETTLRVTGLSRFTEAGRWAFGMELVGHVTDQASKDYGALDAPFRRMLDRYGIDATGWDSIRSTPLQRDRGSDWLFPHNVADHSLGDRLYEAILTETDYAVPTPDIRTRVLFDSHAKKGTWFGESIRSGLLFKGFGVSMLYQQASRVMEAANNGPWSAAKYGAGLFIATTLGGALAMQLKAIARGQDPQPMTGNPMVTGEQVDAYNAWLRGEGKRPKATQGQAFWGGAVLQGGGFGIFGDLLGSSTNRFGGGLASSLVGPLAQPLQGTLDAATSQHPAWALARTARQEVPGQSVWYARLAFDRLVMDQLQQQLDPNYARSWARMEQRAADQRTRMWWRPGETSPDHAPDLSTIAGDGNSTETMQ